VSEDYRHLFIVTVTCLSSPFIADFFVYRRFFTGDKHVISTFYPHLYQHNSIYQLFYRYLSLVFIASFLKNKR